VVTTSKLQMVARDAAKKLDAMETFGGDHDPRDG
jgi:hypothetical protein